MNDATLFTSLGSSAHHWCLMSVTVDAVTYTVPDHFEQFRLPIIGDTTHPYRRNRPMGVPEADEAMQIRIQQDVAARRVRSPPSRLLNILRPSHVIASSCRSFLQRAAQAAAGITTGYATPSASPASQRPQRQPATKGKPSDETAQTSVTMGPPPPSKRHSGRGAQQLAAAGGSMSHAAAAGAMPPPPSRPRHQNSVSGRQQQAVAAAAAAAASAAAPPTPMDMEAFPSIAPRFGGSAPTFGLSQGPLSASAVQTSRDKTATEAQTAAKAVPNAWSQRAGAVSAQPTPPSTPLGTAAADAVRVYESPLTGPLAEPSSLPPRGKTRDANAKAQLELQQKLADMKPGGRLQLAIVLTEEEKRARNTDSKRRSRARAKQMDVVYKALMYELARYDLPLVQLLLAEFADNPVNRGKAGSMRTVFIEQYRNTCHTKHADVPVGMGSDGSNLADLARVLRMYKPARALLQERLRAAKLFTAQSYSGSSI